MLPEPLATRDWQRRFRHVIGLKRENKRQAESGIAVVPFDHGPDDLVDRPAAFDLLERPMTKRETAVQTRWSYGQRSNDEFFCCNEPRFR